MQLMRYSVDFPVSELPSAGLQSIPVRGHTFSHCELINGRKSAVPETSSRYF